MVKTIPKMIKLIFSLAGALIIVVFGYLVFAYLPDLLKPNNGQLRVGVNGNTTTLFLDGKNLGKSPFFGTNLKVGEHLLKIIPTGKSDGYSWEQSVSLASKTVTNVNLDLAPNKLFTASDYLFFSNGGSGISIVTYPKRSLVTIDKKAYGESPRSLDLTVGPHLLTISKEGYLSREISISSEPNLRISAVVYLAADPFVKIDKLETTNKLSLFSIVNPSLDLTHSFSDWALGLGFVQDNLNSGETRFDYLIDQKGKTYVLNKTSWNNKVLAKSSANIGLLQSKASDKMSVSTQLEWDKLKKLFE